jgi:hypothetical protein
MQNILTVDPSGEISDDYDPCKQLLSEVLMAGLYDFVKPKRDRWKANAEVWLYSTNKDCVTDFLAICETLNIDPFEIRKRIEDPSVVKAILLGLAKGQETKRKLENDYSRPKRTRKTTQETIPE